MAGLHTTKIIVMSTYNLYFFRIYLFLRKTEHLVKHSHWLYYCYHDSTVCSDSPSVNEHMFGSLHLRNTYGNIHDSIANTNVVFHHSCVRFFRLLYFHIIQSIAFCIYSFVSSRAFFPYGRLSSRPSWFLQKGTSY
jgi:hypothetical protein